ncbi:MAG TPA: hypothetical protein VLG50_03675 [Candidatus Saccharimonadales bacterium]|nr:hypothetical protein [Candidatus Saccharimonadales bacterium]
MCYKCGLTHADLELFTIGMCLDYIQEYVESMKDKPRRKRATQADMNAF